MEDVAGFENIPLETVMSLGFYVVLGLYIIFVAIMYYHWDTYATDKVVSRFTLLSFFIVTLPLLLIMGAMLFVV